MDSQYEMYVCNVHVYMYIVTHTCTPYIHVIYMYMYIVETPCHLIKQPTYISVHVHVHVVSYPIMCWTYEGYRKEDFSSSHHTAASIEHSNTNHKTIIIVIKIY